MTITTTSRNSSPKHNNNNNPFYTSWLRIIIIEKEVLFLFVVVLLLSVPIVVVSSNNNDDVVASFVLFDNGASKGGVQVRLSQNEFPASICATATKSCLSLEKSGGVVINQVFAMEMSRKYLNITQYRKQPGTVVATKAFREDGEPITRFEQLLPTTIIDDDDDEQEKQQRRIYLVSEDLEFVWPFIRQGHNQTISTNVLKPVDGIGLPIVLESMSETPRVFKVYNLFTSQESQSLMENALKIKGPDALRKSTVGDIDDYDFSGRTSENAWDSTSKAARNVISRSFNLTRITQRVGKVDGLQLVRYQPGQAYNTHPDYFDDDDDEHFNFHPYKGGSNRFATVFLYLNHVEEGGCTVFPRVSSSSISRNTSHSPPPPKYALDMFPKHSWEYDLTYECFDTTNNVVVPPIPGTAALFYSITPQGRLDPTSHHAACPVIKGLKWGANIWIWNKLRYGESPDDDDDVEQGEERELTIQNTQQQTIYISWRGELVAKLKPGESMVSNTYEFHKFQAHVHPILSNKKQQRQRMRMKQPKRKPILPSSSQRRRQRRNNSPISEYTVQSEPYHQVWTIEPQHDSTSSSSSNTNTLSSQQQCIDGTSATTCNDSRVHIHTNNNNGEQTRSYNNNDHDEL